MIPKFRAWIHEDEEMAKVDSINFFNHELELSETTEIIEASINEVELMQSTGLKDKNDVEVYEGDIVHVFDKLDEPPYEAVGHIVYEQDDCAFEIARKKYRIALNRTRFVEYEVIGNIYEHPELLERENK